MENRIRFNALKEWYESNRDACKEVRELVYAELLKIQEEEKSKAIFNAIETFPMPISDTDLM